MGKRENQKAAARVKKGGFEVAIDPFERSVGFRGCPLCRSPHSPFSSFPYFNARNYAMCFASTERLCISEGRMASGRE